MTCSNLEQNQKQVTWITVHFHLDVVVPAFAIQVGYKRFWNVPVLGFQGQLRTDSHRIMNNRISWVGGDPQGSLSPTPSSTQTTWNSNTVSESTVQTLLKLGATTIPLGRLFYAHDPLGQRLSLTSGPPLAQFHVVPSGPVAVTQSRAQCCPPLPVRSCCCHEAPPSLLCSGPSTPRAPSRSSQFFSSRPFTIFIVLFQILHNISKSLYCGTQTCTRCWRWGPTGQSRGRSLSSPCDNAGPEAPRVWSSLWAAGAHCQLMFNLLSVRNPRSLSMGLLSRLLSLHSVHISKTALSQVQKLKLAKLYTVGNCPALCFSGPLYNSSLPSRKSAVSPNLVWSTDLCSMHWSPVYISFMKKIKEYWP